MTSGAIVHNVSKTHLTQQEVDVLKLTPANLTDNRAFRLGSAGSAFCVAICFDGFFEDVLSHLAAQGCKVLLHPTWNPGPWAAYIDTAIPVANPANAGKIWQAEVCANCSYASAN